MSLQIERGQDPVNLFANVRRNLLENQALVIIGVVGPVLVPRLRRRQRFCVTAGVRDLKADPLAIGA